MSEDTTRFSIVTPSFNQDEFLGDTLRSVWNQSHGNVEHLVIDGGSTDDTVNILKKFDKKTEGNSHYNLRWISEADRGQSHAINKGFELATGDLVGWLNSDDMYFDTNTLQAVQDAFENSGAKVVYGDDVLVDPDNRLLRIDHKYEYSRVRLLRSCYICQPALFFDRGVVEDNRLDESLEYVMDYEFWLRLSEKYEFYHLARIVAADRNHGDRKMLTNRDALIPERESVQKEYGQTFGPRYWLGRGADKLYSAWNRLRGLYTAEEIRQRNDFAFNLELDERERIFCRQLFKNNRDLV